MTDKTKPLALVTGVGPGTGVAIVRRFAEGGYRVAMLARDADSSPRWSAKSRIPSRYRAMSAMKALWPTH
jgi:NAD(P)-dependent dehydrogenase (short-subunit alcohol dehydrogenase family)